MKKINKIFKKDSVFVLFIALLLIGPFLIENNNSILISILFFIGLIIFHTLIYFSYKKTYKNLDKLVVLLGLIIIVFPISHLVLFNLDEDNYAYSKDFLNYQKDDIDDKLKSFYHHATLEKILNTNEPILIDESILFNKRDTIVEIGTYLLEISKRENPNYPSLGVGGLKRPPEQKSQIIISSINANKELISIDYAGRSIKTSIKAKLEERKELIQLKKSPISYVGYRDIWIDSFTGFILSNIKPVSFLPQIIQIFQVFIFFIIGSILSGFISNSKSFMLEKKKTKKKN